jgi:hypothetical protein
MKTTAAQIDALRKLVSGDKTGVRGYTIRALVNAGLMVATYRRVEETYTRSRWTRHVTRLVDAKPTAAGLALLAK